MGEMTTALSSTAGNRFTRSSDVPISALVPQEEERARA